MYHIQEWPSSNTFECNDQLEIGLLITCLKILSKSMITCSIPYLDTKKEKTR